MKPRSLAVPLLLAVALLAGCAGGPKGAAYDPKAPPAPYVRVAYPDADTTELQIASRRFVPARGQGPAVWLYGASHIGQSNYYASLQQRLDAHPLVLFEGVGEHARRAGKPKGQSPAPPSPKLRKPSGTNSEDYSLQGTMARSLGLVFQLEAIDYERTNFVNSDLSIAEIQSLMQPGRTFTTGPGKSAAPADDDDGNASFQTLLSAMDGSSTLGVIMKGLMQLVGSSERLQAMTKLALIETLGAMKADPSNMKNLPPDMQELMQVLIRERNKVVIADLKVELKRKPPPPSIAIFYGAGHLPDMEMRLRKELKLRPAEDVWLPAFSVNARTAGLSSFELSFMRTLIRSQLAPMMK